MELTPNDDSYQQLILQIVNKQYPIKDIYLLELYYCEDFSHYHKYGKLRYRLDSIAINNKLINAKMYEKTFSSIPVILEDKFDYLRLSKEFQLRLERTDDIYNISLEIVAGWELQQTFQEVFTIDWSEEIYRVFPSTVYEFDNGILTLPYVKHELLKKTVQDKIDEIMNKHQSRVSYWFNWGKIYIFNMLTEPDKVMHIITVERNGTTFIEKQYREVFNMVRLGFFDP